MKYMLDKLNWGGKMKLFYKKFLIVIIFIAIYATIVDMIFIHTSITKYNYLMFMFGLIVGVLGTLIIDVIESIGKGK